MATNPPQPHVTLNVAISADGKISTYRREKLVLGGKADRYLMDVLRARCDAVVIGARTLQLDGWAIRVRDNELRKKRFSKRGQPHPLNVVMTTALDLKTTSQFFTHARTQRMIITSILAPEARVKRFGRLADVVVVKKKRLTPLDVLRTLQTHGVRRVLLEGGGELNFSFFEAGLVNELYVTVTPLILGGATAPTPVDGTGFTWATHRDLELLSCRRQEEVFLRYRVKP